MLVPPEYSIISKIINVIEMVDVVVASEPAVMQACF